MSKGVQMVDHVFYGGVAKSCRGLVFQMLWNFNQVPLFLEIELRCHCFGIHTIASKLVQHIHINKENA